MDPITVLERRIEQLEAKFGILPLSPSDNGQQGDSAVTNLLNSANSIKNITAGLEKGKEAMERASELNNYMDPNLIEKVQQNELKVREVVAAEPIIRTHCQCMHHCQKAAPVMNSEPLQQVPQAQTIVNEMQTAVKEVEREAEIVSHGVQELAQTCGTAAAKASEQIAAVAAKVDQVEQKLPKRRNGLD
ncbi:hypothetical protein EVAR_98794_1 [Eumeta japonica]|uniref:Uncharacterized protein n=1 Tax=Eumeta variegata TaxID=151549 RepID=A0A4C1XV37_EUMVA|nr:hypothetical protein EVAR_98794_1 [Eumeta japonica]